MARSEKIRTGASSASKVSSFLKSMKRRRAERSRFSKTKFLSSLNSQSRRQYRKLNRSSKEEYVSMVKNQYDYTPRSVRIDANELHYEIIDQIYRQTQQYYRETFMAENKKDAMKNANYRCPSDISGKKCGNCIYFKENNYCSLWEFNCSPECICDSWKSLNEVHEVGADSYRTYIQNLTPKQEIKKYCNEDDINCEISKENDIITCNDYIGRLDSMLNKLEFQKNKIKRKKYKNDISK